MGVASTEDLRNIINILGNQNNYEVRFRRLGLCCPCFAFAGQLDALWSNRRRLERCQQRGWPVRVANGERRAQGTVRPSRRQYLDGAIGRSG